jgi:hypothetical protein
VESIQGLFVDRNKTKVFGVRVTLIFCSKRVPFAIGATGLINFLTYPVLEVEGTPTRVTKTDFFFTRVPSK